MPPFKPFAVKKINVLTLLVCLPCFAMGQWHDMNWILGYDLESDQSLSETMMVSFSTFQPTVISFPLELDFIGANLTLSDTSGNFIFYSNGIQVHDMDDNQMPGSDTLNSGDIASANYLYGYPTRNTIMGLPTPGSSNQYYLVHLRQDWDSELVLANPDLLFSVVDMEQNGGKGAVITDDQLIQRTRDFAWDIAAVRHANGRDWWIMAANELESKFAVSRLTPNGIKDTMTQTIGYKPPYDEMKDFGGNNLFTPDGTKYIDLDTKNGIRIFDFDRCNGILSNFQLLPYPEPNNVLAGGIVSPNSQYLYVTSGHHVFQYDLLSTDIQASLKTVAEYDGFQDGDFPSLFLGGSVAPDGKIYLNTSTRYLHVISKPNQEGPACDVLQRAIDLPEWPTGIPNYPNYRLGPLDGSPCDTLGIDNLPLAHFTYEADDQQPLLVGFTDNSFYEPAEWLWDFGDTGSSEEVDPEHAFPGTGTYTVCLTVGNQYGSDTYCREVAVGLTGASSRENGFGLEVYPNPASEFVKLDYEFTLDRALKWNLINLTGQRVLTVTLPPGKQSPLVPLTALPPGIYFYHIDDNGTVWESGKLIKMK